MPFAIYIVWMLASMVGCYHLTTALIPSDVAGGVARLFFCMGTWFVCLFIGGYLLFKYFPDKPRGKFHLTTVSLRYWSGMSQYTEILEIAPTHGMYEVGHGVNTLYAILEDTDDPTPTHYGSIMDCRPVWVRSLREVEINEQTDLLKITIDKDYVTKVEYLGPTACVTAECKWTFLPGEKK